jgi:post-GPI attachment to proteins factor 3
MRALRPLSFLSGSAIPLIILAAFVGQSWASLGDRLPDFKECVKVFILLSISARTKDLTRKCQICKEENCQDGDSALRK